MTDFNESLTYGIFSTPESRQTIERLKNNRRNFIEFPMVEINPAKLGVEEIETIKKINEFDWLIFFEPTSVEMFLNHFKEQNSDLFDLDNLRICAQSEMTADVLRFEQIHTDIIFGFEPKQLSQLIAAYNGEEKEISNLKILVVDNPFDSNFTTQLIAEFGRHIKFLKLWNAEFTKNSHPGKYLTLLKGGAVDEFILTSPQDLISLHKLDPQNDQTPFAPDLKLRAIGRNLEQYFLDHGVDVTK